MFNFFIIVAVVTAVSLFLSALGYVVAMFLGRINYNKPEAIVPKAGTVKQYCIGLLLFLLIGMTGCNRNGFMPNGCPMGKEKKYKADPKEKFAYKKYTTQW